jgi:sulfite exporter TauE/SafE
MIVLALRVSIPERFAAGAERAVAVMLVVLGLNALWRVMKSSKFHIHTHTHGGRPHTHFHTHQQDQMLQHDHSHVFRLGFRSFVVGMVHGLAGTGALMVVVVAAAPSFLAGSVYILLFGVGSIGGMLILSSLISIPFVVSARSFQLCNSALQFATALLSIGLGLYWISPA